MIRLIAVAAFALAVATSAEAMTPAPIHQPEGVITQVALGWAWVGHELEVSAWPEPPSAMPAGPSAGVRDGTQAFALGTTERPTLRLTRRLADLLRRQMWLFALRCDPQFHIQFQKPIDFLKSIPSGT